jgi:hypothetical protein
VFRRSKPEEAPVTSADERLGKGRPTPTRKEAEAAARARAKAALDPKASRKASRGASRGERSANTRELREGIKRGDERYLGSRDKGPMRRFIRDYVDTRINMAEFALPLLFAGLLLGAVNPGLGGVITQATLLVAVLDSVLLNFRLKRELKRRFPDEAKRRGNTLYAVTRALQFRFMRLPKPQVKLGQKLPERY